jgi:hypothetical protein
VRNVLTLASASRQFRNWSMVSGFTDRWPIVQKIGAHQCNQTRSECNGDLSTTERGTGSS